MLTIGKIISYFIFLLKSKECYWHCYLLVQQWTQSEMRCWFTSSGESCRAWNHNSEANQTICAVFSRWVEFGDKSFSTQRSSFFSLFCFEWDSVIPPVEVAEKYFASHTILPKYFDSEPKVGNKLNYDFKGDFSLWNFNYSLTIPPIHTHAVLGNRTLPGRVHLNDIF